eukprot:3624561-Pleurochrysis_carterae.AAC.1
MRVRNCERGGRALPRRVHSFTYWLTSYSHVSCHTCPPSLLSSLPDTTTSKIVQRARSLARSHTQRTQKYGRKPTREGPGARTQAQTWTQRRNGATGGWTNRASARGSAMLKI